MVTLPLKRMIVNKYSAFLIKSYVNTKKQHKY